MTKLDCNVVSCSYNDDNCCSRQDILVEGTQAKTSSETCCGSFAPKGCGCGSNCHKDGAKRRQRLHAKQRNVSSTVRSSVPQIISALPEAMLIPAVRRSVEVLFVSVN